MKPRCEFGDRCRFGVKQGVLGRGESSGAVAADLPPGVLLCDPGVRPNRGDCEAMESAGCGDNRKGDPTGILAIGVAGVAGAGPSDGCDMMKTRAALRCLL